jgi:hypothetical protein
VKAKSFADREIRYTLKAQGQGAGTFNIGPTSGIVKLAKELDFEDLRQPHVYSLIVTATEDSGGFSTSVEVGYFLFCVLMFVCEDTIPTILFCVCFSIFLHFSCKKFSIWKQRLKSKQLNIQNLSASAVDIEVLNITFLYTFVLAGCD